MHQDGPTRETANAHRPPRYLIALDTLCGRSNHYGVMFRFHALTIPSTSWSSKSPSTTDCFIGWRLHICESIADVCRITAKITRSRREVVHCQNARLRDSGAFYCYVAGHPSDLRLELHEQLQMYQLRNLLPKPHVLQRNRIGLLDQYFRSRIKVRDGETSCGDVVRDIFWEHAERNWYCRSCHQ